MLGFEGENERIAALRERAILDTPPEERFDRVTRLARRLFGVDEALVNLIDTDRQWTKSTSDGPQGSGNEVLREDSFCNVAIEHREGVIVEDALLDERFRNNVHVTCASPVRFYAGMPIAAPSGALVGTLCLVDHQPRTFTAPDLELLRDLASWVEKELNIDRELDRAAEVQRALLPATIIADPRWEVAGACRPSRDVGGDFFDWYRDDTTTAVILADVMGKGMPAAIVAATARAALRSAATAPSPGAQIDCAARTLATDLRATETFVTAFVAHLGADGHVAYADAGHGHSAIRRTGGRIEPLARGTVPIGLGLGLSTDAATHELALQPGDLLVVHSDGLVELPDGPRTTADALVALDARDATTAGDALDRLTAAIGTTAPPDDVTILIIRRVT